MNATCFPTHCFCEALHTSRLFQPINALSSLAFVLAGLWILWRYRNRISALYGVLTIVVGLGSAYFHAHLTMTGQLFDNAGMYLLVTLVIVVIAHRRYRLPRPEAIYVLGNILLLGVIGEFPYLRRYIFAILVAKLLWLGTTPSVAKKYFAWAIATMGLAFALWTLDITGIWCNPQSIIQGHAFWHILGAISATYLITSIQPITSKQ